MKRKLLSILTAIAVVISLSACQAEDTEQAPPLSETVVSETTQVEITTQKSETTVAEILEETQAEENVQTGKNVTETIGEETVETILIANQEIPIDAENVILYISDVQNTTDISGLKNLSNLKSLQLSRSTDGNTPYVRGFDVLKNCDTITSICIQVGFENDEDIYVLDTLPNLNSLTIYGIEAYDFWNFDVPSLRSLSVIGTFDTSKIVHLSNLTSLSMEYNFNSDLSFLNNFPDIEFLQITECGFIDYSSILELKNLKWLFISSYPMTEEMYDQIKNQHPECEITIVNNFIN